MGSIVLAQNLVLSEGDGLTLNHPIFGYRSIVTVLNTEADTEAVGYPAINLVNPATHLRWRAADTTEQYLTVTTLSADDLDYVGIARHNFATAGITVTIEGDRGAGFEVIAGPQTPANNGPLVFRFATGPFVAIRVKLSSGSAVAEAAVLFVGKLLVWPRKLYQGFTPAPYANVGKEINAMAESGDHLGTIITQRRVESKVPVSIIEPDIYRETVAPFIAARSPFFFGWRPEDYPTEIGYMTLINWPQLAPQSPHSLIGGSLEMKGFV